MHDQKQKDKSLAARAIVAVSAAGLCLVASACGHVALPPPPGPDASADDVAAYRRKVRPARQETLVATPATLRINPWWLEVGQRNLVDHVLELDDGTVVRYPEDLVPVLSRNSECARTALKAGDARNVRDGWASGGAGLMCVGFLSFMCPPETLVKAHFALSPATVVAGGASAAMFIVAAVMNGDADQLRAEAFSCYEREASEP
jgi:hypothetical protein